MSPSPPSVASPATKKTPTSLPDLPDELLVRVFQLVYAFEAGTPRRGASVTFKRIRINRRIYRLAYPVWLEHISFPDFSAKNQSVDVFFGGLIEHTDEWIHIKSVEVRSFVKTANLVVGSLAVLPSLESLTITTSAPLPRQLLRVLTQKKTLDHLTLRDGAYLEGLDLSELSVRRFSTDADSTVLNIGKADKLEELELWRIGVDDYGDLPWASLKVLRLPGSKRGSALLDGDRGFCQGLMAAASLRPSLPLTTFELGMDDLPLAGRVDQLAVQRARQQRRVLLCTVLDKAKPRHLKLTRFGHCPSFEPNELFRSVEILEVEGWLRLHDANHLEAFDNFLRFFPSVTRLMIRDLRFHASYTSLASDYVALRPVKFCIRWPTFAGLYASLAGESDVLEWEVSQPLEDGVLRFTRDSPEEGFQVVQPALDLRRRGAELGARAT